MKNKVLAVKSAMPLDELTAMLAIKQANAQLEKICDYLASIPKAPLTHIGTKWTIKGTK